MRERRKQSPGLPAEAACSSVAACGKWFKEQDFSCICSGDLFIMALYSSLPAPMEFLPLPQERWSDQAEGQFHG